MNRDTQQRFEAIEPEPVGLAGLAPVETLGQKLASQAQQMAARQAPDLPWLRALTPVLGRLAALPTPDAGHFRRVERGALPLPAAPRVRSSTDEAGSGSIEPMARTDALPSFAQIGESVRFAPDAGIHNAIHPSAGSVAVHAVQPADRVDEHPGEAPLTPAWGAHGPLPAGASPVAGSVVRSGGQIDAATEDASTPPHRATHSPLRSTVSPPAGSGMQPARDAAARAGGAPLPPAAPTPVPTQPAASSSAETSRVSAGDQDTRPERPAGQPVSPHVHMRLVELVGSALPAIHVRDDVEAEAVVRSQKADAVTVGNQVLLRAERYRPHTPQGLALLAHEAVHVAAAQQSNVAWQRATAAGRAEEERQALHVERAALGSAWEAPINSHRAGDAAPGGPSTLPAMQSPQPPATSDVTGSLPAMHTAGSADAPAGALQPMAASANRDLEGLAASPAPAPAPSFQDLREALYRDLMRQLRADFERGG